MTDAEKALKWCAELIADTDELLPDSSDALKRELVGQKECARLPDQEELYETLW